MTCIFIAILAVKLSTRTKGFLFAGETRASKKKMLSWSRKHEFSKRKFHVSNVESNNQESNNQAKEPKGSSSEHDEPFEGENFRGLVRPKTAQAKVTSTPEEVSFETTESISYFASS